MRNTATTLRSLLVGVLFATPTFAATWSVNASVANEAAMTSSLRAAANNNGREAMSWIENGHLTVNLRDGVSNWPAPLHLPTPPAGNTLINTDLVVAANGDVTVAWLEGPSGNFRLRTDTLRNGIWQPVVTLSDAPTRAAAIGIDAAGDITAAWMQYDAVAGTCDIRAADAGAGAGYTASTSLSHDCRNEIDLSVNGRGDALIAWSNRLVIYGGSPVVVAQRRAGGGWSLPTVVAAPTYRSHSARVALADNGRAVAIWADAYGPQYARRNANGVWSNPGPVDTLGMSSYTGYVDVVVDALGNATAVLGVWDTSFNFQGLAARKLAAGAFNWSWPLMITPAGATIDTATVSGNGAGTVIVGWFDGTANAVTGLANGVGVSLRENGLWSRKRFAADYREMAVAATDGKVFAGWNAGAGSRRILGSDSPVP